MSKKSLTNGVVIKTEQRSGFDKSFFNALTTGVGTLTPLVKQLVIPNSDGKCTVRISAQLPPLAADAYIRSHLKLEGFFCPMRLCYGGFESWFCGKEIYIPESNTFTRAKLPRLMVPSFYDNYPGTGGQQTIADKAFAQSSLLDYFGAYWKANRFFNSNYNTSYDVVDPNGNNVTLDFVAVNIFPWLCYGLIYDEYYRNKLVEKPLFSAPRAKCSGANDWRANGLGAWALPYISAESIIDVIGASNAFSSFDSSEHVMYDNLLNGALTDIRQRNYGDDYFTAATPQPQEGNPITIGTVGNQFTISAFRLGAAMQEFAELNNFASPDYIQTLSARYGASLKAGIAQKPILLGSADFAMYTSGVEQTAQGTSQSVNNPFDTVGARYGRAHAEGTDFVCSFNADEPGYFFVVASLVPEAQYYEGVAKDLMLFTDDGSLTDLPTGIFEHIGNQGISLLELDSSSADQPFGYVQRYLFHKLGNRNQVHGLFRKDESLGAFVVQRDTRGVVGINSTFLKVLPTDLDNVAAVSAGISRFGVMIDSSIQLFVSEPLTESAIPCLANPSKEHGRSVYVKTGGSKLA